MTGKTDKRISRGHGKFFSLQYRMFIPRTINRQFRGSASRHIIPGKSQPPQLRSHKTLVGLGSASHHLS